jgi:hypothetical protein
MAGYAVAHLDEIEEFSDAGCHYRPIRHHLGITAFGATAWTAGAAGDLVINEHDEDDPTADQELFLVLRGHAVFEIDGDRVDAPAGTLVFAAPRTKRMASATEEGTTIIALEGTPGQAYEARGWELWAPLAPLYQAGEYARSPTVWAPWSQPLRSTPCCSSTSPAARASAAGQVTRSITSGTPSRCQRSFALPQRPTPTSIRSATNPRSSN